MIPQEPQWLAFLPGEVGGAIGTVNKHSRKPHGTKTIKAGRIEMWEEPVLLAVGGITN